MEALREGESPALCSINSTSLRISIRILKWHKGKKHPHPIPRRLRRSVATNQSEPSPQRAERTRRGRLLSHVAPPFRFNFVTL